MLDNSRFTKWTFDAGVALLISGPRVRVPGGAPQAQNPNLFPIGEGFGFFVFFGELNQGAIPCPKPYQKAGRAKQ